jgi:hypothetical protein
MQLLIEWFDPFGFIDHFIVEARSECFLKDVHDRHSMVSYYPIEPKCFKEIECVFHLRPTITQFNDS